MCIWHFDIFCTEITYKEYTGPSEENERKPISTTQHQTREHKRNQNKRQHKTRRSTISPTIRTPDRRNQQRDNKENPRHICREPWRKKWMPTMDGRCAPNIFRTKGTSAYARNNKCDSRKIPHRIRGRKRQCNENRPKQKQPWIHPRGHEPEVHGQIQKNNLK